MSPERSFQIDEFEQIVERAKKLTLMDGGHVPILIAAGSRTRSIYNFSVMPDTHDERFLLMQSAGRYLAEHGKIGRLRQVFFISEGWMSMASRDKPPQMRPSEDPSRKEVLIVSGLDIEGQKKYMQLFEMVRDQNKKIVELPEFFGA